MNTHKNPLPITSVVLGARGSSLSQAQLHEVSRLLAQVWPQVQVKQRTVKTTGDRMVHLPLPQVGQKGMFTDRLLQALQDNEVDAAVHSYKDMALDIQPFPMAAVLPRLHPADALVSRDHLPLHQLPAGSRVGTSSPRRAALLLHTRPDLRVVSIRGNLDTRLTKLDSGKQNVDALIVAYCGLQRLNLSHRASEILDPTLWPPAPGQGALAVQCCNRPELLQLFLGLHHQITHLETVAERAFLAALGGGCGLPIGAYGHWKDKQLHLHASVLASNGSERIDLQAQCACSLNEKENSNSLAQNLGDHLGKQALQQGAKNLMDSH